MDSFLSIHTVYLHSNSLLECILKLLYKMIGIHRDFSSIFNLLNLPPNPSITHLIPLSCSKGSVFASNIYFNMRNSSFLVSFYLTTLISFIPGETRGKNLYNGAEKGMFLNLCPTVFGAPLHLLFCASNIPSRKTTH